MRRALSGAGPVRLEVTYGGDAVYGEDYGAAPPAVLGCAAEALGDSHLVSFCFSVGRVSLINSLTSGKNIHYKPLMLRGKIQRGHNAKG